ncbi:MAG: hypothetical protein IJ390_06235 [Lachnospiraceae bacterium]|nr:hypothetical protein [Lachnospiraceae bacterium]
MKNKWLRLMALTMSAVMAFSVAGCGDKAASDTTASKDDSAAVKAEADGAEVAEDEVVTLKMFIRNSSKYTGLQEDPVAKYIEEKLGIRIELTVDSSLGSTTAQASTFDELLATKLATNDMDDIMDFGSTSGNPECVTNLQNAAEAGMIMPLDDLVAEYTTNLSSDPRLTVRNDYRRENMYSDGKFYSVGGWGGMGLDQLPGAAVWIRWDAYKEMGYPEIKSDDQLLEVLAQMQEKYPETPAGDKIYAVGGGFADAQGMGDGFLNRDYPLTKGYESLEGNYAVYFNHATREVENLLSDADSVFWNGVEFYFKANQMGLLDPGAMTMSSSEYSEKVNKGQYLAGYNGWTFMGKEAVLEGLGMADSGYMPLDPFDDVESMALYWESVLGGNEFAISSTCEHPDKAIQFLDWCMSEEGSRMITQGAEGLAYTVDENGTPSLTEQFKTDNAEGVVDMAEAYGKWKYAGINAFQHIDTDANGNYIQPEQTPDVENYSAVKKDALANYYKADSFTEHFTTLKTADGEDLPTILWGSYAAAIGTKPDDIKQKYGQINDFMYKQIFKMVYAADEAEYETLKAEAIEEVNNLGIDDVFNWYDTRMKEIRGNLDALIDEAVKAY